MIISTLGHQTLFRPGSKSGGCTVAERYSLDFIIDGDSLLQTLVRIDGGHDDFSGCFVKGFTELNAEAATQFLPQVSSDHVNGHALLYLCPECGDIGCGAYSVHIERTDDGYIWRDFAYENGYEEPLVIEAVGPFFFERMAYESAIRHASIF